MTADDRSIGALLKEARERQGLPLEGIAHSLRIPLKTLRALEEEDFTSLPADVYVRGFLKQYAAVLGLDPVPLIRAFAVERARHPSVAPMFPWTLRGAQRSRLWEIATPRFLSMTGGGAVLLVILLYVLFNVRTYTRAPRLLVVEPPQDVEVQGPTIAVHGRTDPTAEVLINGERTAVRDDGTFEETLGVGEGVNTLRFIARSIGGRETVIVREVLYRPSPRETPADLRSSAAGLPAETLAKAGPFALTVRADKETVWVSLTVDGKPAFAGLLLPGSEHTVRGERVAVTSGKAAQTVIQIEGHAPAALAPDVPGLLRDILFTRDPQTGIVERTQVSPPSPTPRP